MLVERTHTGAFETIALTGSGMSKILGEILGTRGRDVSPCNSIKYIKLH